MLLGGILWMKPAHKWVEPIVAGASFILHHCYSRWGNGSWWVDKRVQQIRLYLGFSALGGGLQTGLLVNALKSLRSSQSQSPATQNDTVHPAVPRYRGISRPSLNHLDAHFWCLHVSLPCNCLTKWVWEALRSRITSTSHCHILFRSTSSYSCSGHPPRLSQRQ